MVLRSPPELLEGGAEGERMVEVETEIVEKEEWCVNLFLSSVSFLLLYAPYLSTCTLTKPSFLSPFLFFSSFNTFLFLFFVVLVSCPNDV